ncbi:hypothetical protein CCR97_08010 [Rhodoplanes elegans]|uniref:Uncharacterized protein n=1 Tax=Rhodoplanes elegans TaxID=29408 RepID=A0A327KSZ4_9BRAD|nr:hypothetical protein [Rhodoplanes elegans]MBK5958063.1 hypothetical protein [Rhodoplanes elegans]MBK5958155.1 hypothetical protein [Rhodoplanes elegans]RAI40442.1 hypothetical protein CH338_06260 [Rhodoplanes elegans]
MRTTTVSVTQEVSITIDRKKFTPDFMAEYRASFYPFDTIERHIEHIAQLYARGLVDKYTTFIEGYGDLREMGISLGSKEVVSMECLPNMNG